MSAHSYPKLNQKLSRLRFEERQVQNRYLWRSLLVCAFVGGLVSAALSPYWKIKSPEQFQLKGDRFTNPEAIYNVLQIPQKSAIAKSQVTFAFQDLAIWKIDSKAMDRQLEAIPALRSVKVNKKLFPPSVNIYLQERIPVVVATAAGEVGFLDYQGVWLDPTWYKPQTKNLPLTKIKVVNFQSDYQAIWTKIYQLINAYPNIEVKEIQWQEEGNIVVITNGFKAVLGNDETLLERQFASLASFTDSAKAKNLTGFSQIDLKDPERLFLSH